MHEERGSGQQPVTVTAGIGWWPWLGMTLERFAEVLDRLAGRNGAACIDAARQEITVTDRGWTLRVLWDEGQGWLYAIEDDAAWNAADLAVATLDAGPVTTPDELVDGDRRFATRQFTAMPAGAVVLVLLAPPCCRHQLGRARRRPLQPRPRVLPRRRRG